MTIYTALEPNDDKSISYEKLCEKIGGAILANTAREEATKMEEIGILDEYCGSIYDEENDSTIDVYQSYIISEWGAGFLKSYTDEIVVYSPTLDLYFWEITHYGTAWAHVFTSLK